MKINVGGRLKMKLAIWFKSEKIPCTYNFLFVSLIKSALMTIDPEFVESLYYKNGKENQNIKDFAFAVYLNNFRRKKEEFFIDGDIRLTIGTSNYKFLLFLQNGFMTKKDYQYKEYFLKVMKIQLLHEGLPQEEYGLFQTLSPITIKGQDNKFLSPFDVEYEGSLQFICNEIMKEISGRQLYKPLRFTPVQMKKVVVKLKHDVFSNMNDEETFFVEAYKGIFKLEGAVEDLKLLTQTGIGYRRSQGFGLIQYIGQ